jgi:hypothetical protein
VLVWHRRQLTGEPRKPPLTCGSVPVSGATRGRFDLFTRTYVMFSSSPGSGGTQGREAGRPAPGETPKPSPHPRCSECALCRPQIDSAAAVCGGPEKRNPGFDGASGTR